MLLGEGEGFKLRKLQLQTCLLECMQVMCACADKCYGTQISRIISHTSRARTTKRVKRVLLRFLTPLLLLLPHALCQNLYDASTDAHICHTTHITPVHERGCIEREHQPWVKDQQSPVPAQAAD
jgi:hypothetical protein